MTKEICESYENLRRYIQKATGPHRALLIRLAADALSHEQDSKKVEELMRVTEFQRALGDL